MVTDEAAGVLPIRKQQSKTCVFCSTPPQALVGWGMDDLQHRDQKAPRERDKKAAPALKMRPLSSLQLRHSLVALVQGTDSEVNLVKTMAETSDSLLCAGEGHPKLTRRARLAVKMQIGCYRCCAPWATDPSCLLLLASCLLKVAT